jgi:hypothetical protein
MGSETLGDRMRGGSAGAAMAGAGARGGWSAQAGWVLGASALGFGLSAVLSGWPGVMSIAYIASRNPLAAVLSHVAMHVAAVLHGIDSTVQLPPHG